jgi:hypothetical protein
MILLNFYIYNQSLRALPLSFTETQTFDHNVDRSQLWAACSCYRTIEKYSIPGRKILRFTKCEVSFDRSRTWPYSLLDLQLHL